MYQHPFARAVSPAIGEYTHISSKSKRRPAKTYPSGKVASSSHLPVTKPGPAPVQVQCLEESQGRPPCKFVVEDAGTTLTLNGQEANATVPVYGKGAILDGTVSLVNPSVITKVEVKMEGYVKLRSSGGDAQSDTCVLSELLVFWDAPNRLGGYGNTSASGEFAPVPGTCPHTFTFKTTLPTQYTEEPDGETYPLPPSFDETLGGIPGFRCVVRYAISVRVTRVRDMRVKSLRAQWNRKTVLRTPVVYRPKTRPSQPGPFPVNSKPNAGPVTRFDAMIESGSLFIEPIRTMLYLPNSQITSLTSPIPFFLRLSGPEATIATYGRPPLCSFLPKTGSEGFTTICEMISHVVGENVLGRVLSFPGAGTTSSWTPLSSHEGGENEYGYDGREKKRKGTRGGQLPLTGVSVTLVRQVSIHHDEYGLYKRYNNASANANSDADANRDLNLGSTESYVSSESFWTDDADDYRDGRGDAHIHKNIILGEGMMYTASVARGRVTWAGEIRVDPQLDVKTGGFRTGNLVVKDVLVVSVKAPHPQTTQGPSRIFQQVIPVQLTTDTFKQEYN